MKTPKKPSKSRPAIPSKPKPPSFANLAAWQALVGSNGLAAYSNEGILLAFDHFRPIAIQKGVESHEHRFAQALLAHLTNLAIHRLCFSIRHRNVKSGHASAYKTAYAMVVAAITDTKSNRWQIIRRTFLIAVDYCAAEALRQEFGRCGSAWNGARFVGNDNDPESSNPYAARRNGYAIATPVVAGSLEDEADVSDLNAALMRTLRAEPDHDTRHMAHLIYLGYSAESLVPKFGVSAPTIRARVAALGLSKHLKGYK